MPHATRTGSMFQRFFRNEASGGVVLLAATALALVVANGPLGPAYAVLLHLPLGPFDLHHWINDGLMVLFFLLVGLEVKRELVDGHLAQPAARTLPVLAAVGGMAVPALLYLAVAGTTPGLARGWAVPTATDIAFAVGILALLGDRVPASLKLLLVTIAIVDDIGAVLVIAAFYSAGLDPAALALAAGILALMTALNRGGHRALPTYLALTVALWGAVLLSGVHATVAGVLAAFAMPLRPAPGRDVSDQPRAGSPLVRLEHGLQPIVAAMVVPLFALANAGLSFAGLGAEALFAPLPVAIALGLFAGKQAGVFLAIRGAVALGLGDRPFGASWAGVYGVALLCGIGFTMSLFIGSLAFADPLLADEVKLGVLGGSLMSAVAGLAVLRFAPIRAS